MDAELKTKWVAALRSGEYQQCKTTLRNEANQYCCLGVLCAVMGIDVPLKGQGELYDTRIQPVLGETLTIELYNRNDGWRRCAHTFPEIADYIEANL